MGPNRSKNSEERFVRAPPGAEEFDALLRDETPRVRALAARLAGRIGFSYARGDLRALATADPSAAVRSAAADALAALTPRGGAGSEIVNTHGGYGELKAHQSAEIAYDATVAFCDRFIDRRSRTHDQMVQAARSGKQNIVEGSAAAGFSSKTEIKLIGVARASLEELIADYKDFLRQRGLQLWDKDDPRSREIRRLAYVKNRSYETYRPYVEQRDAETAANTVLCVAFQTTYLLNRLIERLENDFLEKGGLSERMTAARLRKRREQA